MNTKEFTKLVNSTSFKEVGKQLGISGNAVKKRAKKLGVYSPRRKYTGHNSYLKGVSKKTILCVNCNSECRGDKRNNRKFCSRLCATSYIQGKAYDDYISRWKAGNEDGIKGKVDISGYIRRYIFKKYNSKCCKCGWDKINPFTQKSTLQINHIDGNCRNNLEDNLELICPNCHSLTNTWGSINKSIGRRKILAEFSS